MGRSLLIHLIQNLISLAVIVFTILVVFDNIRADFRLFWNNYKLTNDLKGVMNSKVFDKLIGNLFLLFVVLILLVSNLFSFYYLFN